MAIKTLLTDNSHWEGKIDWKLASPAMGGCINKATEHISFIDDQFANNKAGCSANGEPNGAYHFFRPAYDPILQAQHFLRTVGTGIKVLACDVESAIMAIYNAKHRMGTRGVQRMAAVEHPDTEEINQIIQDELAVLRKRNKLMGTVTLPDLVERFLDYIIGQVSGCKPVFYSSPYFWKEHMKRADGTYPNWNGKYFLWLAHYYVTEPMLPAPWTDYLIHQYTDKLTLPGIPSQTDGDWFKGDQNAINAFFGNAGSVIPPPPPPPVVIVFPKTFTPINQDIFIRSTPQYYADGSNCIGVATMNKVWTATAIAKDNLGQDWWQVNPKGFCAKWLTRW
jgi:lysozyme